MGPSTFFFRPVLGESAFGPPAQLAPAVPLPYGTCSSSLAYFRPKNSILASVTPLLFMVSPLPDGHLLKSVFLMGIYIWHRPLSWPPFLEDRCEALFEDQSVQNLILPSVDSRVVSRAHYASGHPPAPPPTMLYTLTHLPGVELVARNPTFSPPLPFFQTRLHLFSSEYMTDPPSGLVCVSFWAIPLMEKAL